MPARRDAEILLRDAAGALWAAIGRDPAVAPADDYAPNESYSYVLARAARVAGLAPTSPLTVTDADLAGLDDAKVDLFVTAATLHMLETIVDNWSKVTQASGGTSKSLSDVPGWVRPRIDQLRAQLAVAGAIGVVDAAAPTVPLGSGWIVGPGRSRLVEF